MSRRTMYYVSTGELVAAALYGAAFAFIIVEFATENYRLSWPAVVCVAMAQVCQRGPDRRDPWGVSYSASDARARAFTTRGSWWRAVITRWSRYQPASPFPSKPVRFDKRQVMRRSDWEALTGWSDPGCPDNEHRNRR